MKQCALLASCVLLLLCLFSCADTAPETPADPSQPPAADTQTDAWLPQMETEDLDGNAVSGNALLSDTLTVVNLWGTWCPPCIEELPELEILSQTYSAQGVTVIGVLQDGVDDYGEKQDDIIAAAKTILEDAGVTYPMILPDAVFTDVVLSQVYAFPTTFFLDQEGNVVKTVVGSNTAEKWSEIVDEVLQSLS